MDFLFLTGLMLTPVVALLVWLLGWSKNSNSLVVVTIVVGIILYFCSAYAIHANFDFWAETIASIEIAEITKNAESVGEDWEEQVEAVRARSGRRVHSATSLSLPVMTTVWYSMVLLGWVAWIALGEGWRTLSGAFSLFRRKD